MNQSAWKLSTYFSERLRTVGGGARRPGFLADQILDLFDTHEIATSVMLRGIASFGPLGVLRSDESLSLSEDPPAVIYAVDVESKISALSDDVQAMTAHGLITLERARLVRGDIAPAMVEADTRYAVKLTIYVGRQERVAKLPAYRAICDLLYRHGFVLAAALLGVDGTADGERYRARLFSRNVNVPLVIISVGSPAQVSAAVTELSALIPHLLLTVERIQVCKRDGKLLGSPPKLPAHDEKGRALWQKLTVHTTEAASHDGAPIHRALVRRLLHSKMTQGATALRGIWGFHGDRMPHGDRLFQLIRQVPVVTIIVDTPESIVRSFEVVNELTADHGVVTCEMVPAALSINAPGRRGDLRPAHYHH